MGGGAVGIQIPLPRNVGSIAVLNFPCSDFRSRELPPDSVNCRGTMPPHVLGNSLGSEAKVIGP